MKRKEIFARVNVERERQDHEHPPGGVSRHHYMTILGEEFGELCRAILENDDDQMRDEAIQVAAVAIAFLEIYG